MQFFKATVFSFLAVSSLVAAAPYPDPEADNMEVEELSRRDAALDAHEDYLVAREEYVEKRDLFRRVSPSPIPPTSPFALLTSPAAWWQRNLHRKECWTQAVREKSGRKVRLLRSMPPYRFKGRVLPVQRLNGAYIVIDSIVLVSGFGFHGRSWVAA
jgi:hypothetical protein